MIRPALKEIFPKRKFVNRQLFDLDSRLNYKKLMPVYESLYQNLGNQSYKVPKVVDGSDLMIMKKVLEKFRTYSSTRNRHLVELENDLVEKAAELGNNDAIALLAFETLLLKDTQVLNPGDKEYATELINRLYNMDHPLSVKLLGDLALSENDAALAKKLYHEFLCLESDTVLSSQVYQQLGRLEFQNGNIHDAKLYLVQSIKFGTLEKTLECHYLLGVIYMASDPKLARFHLQLAASKSFLQSFKSLGFLELNYFNNFVKAREWFKLGIQVSDYECLIGLFDTFYKFQDYKGARKTLDTIKRVFTDQNGNGHIFTEFMKSRNTQIEAVNSYDASSVWTSTQ